ncbi:hypothetical protein HDV05_007878, partial [Chytridiales sp. JEL 0842]
IAHVATVIGGYRYEQGEGSVVEEVEAYVLMVGDQGAQQQKGKARARPTSFVGSLFGSLPSPGPPTSANTSGGSLLEGEADGKVGEEEKKEEGGGVLMDTKFRMPFQVPNFTSMVNEVEWNWSHAVPYVPDEVLKMLDERPLEVEDDDQLNYVDPRDIYTPPPVESDSEESNDEELEDDEEEEEQITPYEITFDEHPHLIQHPPSSPPPPPRQSTTSPTKEPEPKTKRLEPILMSQQTLSIKMMDPELSETQIESEREAIKANVLRCLDSPPPPDEEESSAGSNDEEDGDGDGDDEEDLAQLLAEAQADPEDAFKTNSVNGDELGLEYNPPSAKVPKLLDSSSSTSADILTLPAYFYLNGRKPPTSLERLRGKPKFSDGDARTHPELSHSVSPQDKLTKDASTLAIWLAKLDLEKFPTGYRLFLVKTNPGGEARWDPYLYGHPR